MTILALTGIRGEQAELFTVLVFRHPMTGCARLSQMSADQFKFGFFVVRRNRKQRRYKPVFVMTALTGAFIRSLRELPLMFIGMTI